MVIHSNLPNQRIKLRNRLKLLQRRIRSLEGRAVGWNGQIKTQLKNEIESLRQEHDKLNKELYPPK